MMRTVQEIEQAVAQLSKDQLAEFRAWYEQFNADEWDRQIEEDIVAGKLDALADAAITDHQAGRRQEICDERRPHNQREACKPASNVF